MEKSASALSERARCSDAGVKARNGGHPMIAILIYAGLSGVVLGATSRIIFILPAALAALAVAVALIARPDIDLGLAALGATLLNAGFLLGVAMAPVLAAFISLAALDP